MADNGKRTDTRSRILERLNSYQDIKNVDEEYSIYDYQKDVRNLIKELEKKK